MTQPETSDSIPVSDREDENAASTEAAENAEAEEAEPEPEPWTAESVTTWNRYYDVYVMLGVLLLAFVASSNKIAHTSIWSQLQAGRLMAAKGAPMLTDVFSYTEPGVRWVNIPWLFEWSHAAIFKAAADLTPAVPNDTDATRLKAEQVGAGALVAINALARLLTALVLLSIRRRGPGKWWSAVCVALALGAMIGPVGQLFGPSSVVLGGIAGPAIVGPGTWGVLLLAIELWLIDRATRLGSRRSAYALVPLFLLWANVDDSFLVGLLVLAATAVGTLIQAGRRRGTTIEPDALPAKVLLGALAGSAVAVLANPSLFLVYPAAIDPLLGFLHKSRDLTIDQLSYFGSEIANQSQVGDAVWKLRAYYLVVVGIGFVSFAVNRERFKLGRFLAYTMAALLWGMLIRFGAEFAVVLAVTLALNGQEWYQARFGTEGKLGRGWTLWSVGGRAVTIVLVFFCVGKALTGWGSTVGESQFGFGFDRDEFAFEAADYLKTAPIAGNILNTSMGEGDALIWRAYPDRKAYVDSRQHVYPPAVLAKLQDTRRALAEDDVERWKPLLDEYKISAVMLRPSTSPKTYVLLMQSPHWVPFYDDGAVAMFGRKDAPAADLAFFEKSRLDADARAYVQAKPTPSPERPPTPMSWMDNIFQGRTLVKPQPHTLAARRWMAGASLASGQQALPDPARCLIAIREARTALASKPDDPEAFRVLADAYRALMVQETALLAGIALTPENADRIAQVNPRPDVLTTRTRERVTALNYAIQTTPPPRTIEARRELQALNAELFQLFASTNFNDLARDRLQALVDKESTPDLTAEARTRLSQEFAQFNERIDQIQVEMKKRVEEKQEGPLQLAAFALSQGAPGLAIHELEEAERTGTNPALVKPQLLDLYCDTGQPERAVEMLSSTQVEDPSLGNEAGVSAMRQSRAYFLMGNNDYAATLMEKYAIPRLRYERAMQAMGATQAFIKGEVRIATGTYLEIPEKVRTQATWEFESGLFRLEAGTPELAAGHFTKALTLSPRFSMRPIAAYYLEKLGKPVPPLDPEPAKGKDEVAAKADAPKPEPAATK